MVGDAEDVDADDTNDTDETNDADDDDANADPSFCKYLARPHKYESADSVRLCRHKAHVLSPVQILAVPPLRRVGNMLSNVPSCQHSQ